MPSAIVTDPPNGGTNRLTAASLGVSNKSLTLSQKSLSVMHLGAITYMQAPIKAPGSIALQGIPILMLECITLVVIPSAIRGQSTKKH